MPRDDFDSAWKEALTQYLPAFFDFFYPQLRHLVRWEMPIRFLDKELRAIKPRQKGEGGKRAVDVLAELHWVNEGPLLVLFHIEVQSQKDPTLPARLFHYHSRLSELYDRPLATLVILADPSPTWRPQFYQKSFIGTRLRFDFPVIKVADYQSQLFWLQHLRNPFALLIAATLHGQAARADSSLREDSKFELVKALHRLGLDRSGVLSFFRLIDAVLSLSEERRMSFQQRVEDYEKEMDMPYITSVERSGIEKGRIEGRVEGRIEGRVEGRVEGRAEGQREALIDSVSSVLTARFGEIPPTLRGRLVDSEVETLKALLPHAATDGSLGAFETRLLPPHGSAP